MSQPTHQVTHVPVCFTTVALTVIATASGSALTVFVAKSLRVPVAARTQPPNRDA